MVSKVELGSLLDLAIGKPETGAVNFQVLHSFLQKLLGHLAVSNVEVEVFLDKKDKDDESNILLENEEAPASGPELKIKHGSKLFPSGGAVERRIHDLEDKMNFLDSFAETDEILNWAKGREKSNTKVADMWNFINFQKRIEASENGIKTVGSLVDKILAQLQNVTDLQDRMFKMEKRMNELEKLQEELKRLSEKINILVDDKKVDELIDELNKMKALMANMPIKKDLMRYVKWPDLQSALETGKINNSDEKTETQLKSDNQEGEEAHQNDVISAATQSLHPSPLVLHKLGELGGLSKAHWLLKEDVEKMKLQLNSKADKTDLEGLSSGEVPYDLIQQLEALHGALDDLKLWRQDVDVDRASIGSMKTDFDEMKRNIERLQTTMKHVVEEHTRKQVHIDSLYGKTDKLEETKADKMDMDIQLSNKVDKTDLENFVSRQRFDTNIGRIDDALKELIDQVKTSDDNLNKIISKLLNDLQGKLDRDEFLDFKEKLENRLKALKLKVREEPVMDEDPAAAFKKAMLQFNCLSCDRPVYFSGSGPIQGYSGFSASKSGRPYTSYDLEQVRLLQKASLKPEAPDYTMPRSCGGSHTSGHPARRITAKLMANASSYEESQSVPVPPPVLRSEVDIQGHDGKLYKGRIDKNEEFPSVKNGRVKPKSAHGSRTPNVLQTGEGNLIPRRPKTAFSRSPRSESSERQQFYQRTPSPEIEIVQDENIMGEDVLT